MIMKKNVEPFTRGDHDRHDVHGIPTHGERGGC